MKFKLLFLVPFLTSYLNCKAQDSTAVRSTKDVFVKEQNEFGKPIWSYLGNEFTSLHRLEQPTFTKKIDSLRGIYLSHLKGYKNKLQKDTYEDELLGINAAFDKYLLEYPQHHNYLTEESIELSKENQERLSEYNKKFNNPTLLSNRDFIAYLKSLINVKSRNRLDKGMYKGKDNQQLLADWDVINATFSNPEVNCYWKQDYLFNHINNYGIKNIDSVYNDFLSSCQSQVDLSKVKNIYADHKNGRASHLIKVYKEVDGYELEMHLFLPDTNQFKGNRPTIVYFHGGSWSEGKPDWFFGTGEAYTKEGWVAAAVEYRIKGRHGNYPFESVKDAKSAIRWLRKNAEQYNIDPNKIIATGNSAGGHLAIATTLVGGWDAEIDDIEIDPVPNIVIANSAVYDLTVENSKWIVENINDKVVVNEISPNSLVAKTPTKYLLIHGENDKRCTYESAQYFYDKMKALGNDVQLHKIEGANHFIWFGKHAGQVSKITQNYIDALNLE